MSTLYTLGIWIYTITIKAASLFSKKAKAWVQGRSSQATSWLNLSIDKPPIWFHCSSLGEFEQARPIIELLKTNTQEKILLTFFSPSGYLPTQDYTMADWIYYLPADLPKNTQNWINKFSPKLLILTKYDFWYNYIHACHKQQIPIILISAVFRSNQYLFKPYGRAFRLQLQKFKKIFTQNEATLALLQRYEFSNLQTAGDTRIDRVHQIAKNADPLPKIKDFCAKKRTVILGSSWYEEEDILISWMNQFNIKELKFILVPHDVSRKKIDELKAKITVPYSLWSDGSLNVDHQVLIIDTIGLLNKIYQYGWLAFIGGGFRKNIHNILEPMAHQLPVIIGPNFKNFPEAVEMVKSGGAFVIHDHIEFEKIINQLSDQTLYNKSTEVISSYIQENRGASDHIFKYLQQNFLI